MDRKTVDPRIKLTLLPIASFTSFFISDTILLFGLLVFAFFLYVCSGMWKRALRFILFFVLLYCIELGVYSCGNVPSFRRNGYRCSGRSIPSDRNRIPPASFWLVRVYSLNAGSSPYTSLMDL